MRVLRGMWRGALVLVLLVLPFISQAAAIPFFGPIIPEAQSLCPGNWSLVIIVINRSISLAITLLIVLVAPIMFAYAGFKILANPASPGARTEAKKMLLNLFGGIALSLGAWVLVDAFMAVLYKPGSATENWYALISGNDTNLCIEVAAALNQATPSGNPATGVTASGTPITSAGGYSYDPGIDAQIQTESAALSSLLSCVRGKLPPGVGRISSISDSVITSGKHTFADCAAQGHAICSHTGSSCHYGGSGKCTGQSYAVDFGDDENMSVLKSAVTACGGSALNEGNHLHASVGAQNGCGCDVGLRGI